MPRSYNETFIDKFSYVIVDNIIPYLIKLNIHPNVITLLGFIPIYLVYTNILANNVILTYLFAFINCTMDCLDGELARKTGKISKLGGILDSIHDVLSFFSVLYLILNFYTIPIALIFIIFVMNIFDFDPINHTATKYENIFNYLHDNIFIFYYLLITFALIYLRK